MSCGVFAILRMLFKSLRIILTSRLESLQYALGIRDFLDTKTIPKPVMTSRNQTVVLLQALAEGFGFECLEMSPIKLVNSESI